MVLHNNQNQSYSHDVKHSPTRASFLNFLSTKGEDDQVLHTFYNFVPALGKWYPVPYCMVVEVVGSIPACGIAVGQLQFFKP